MGQNYEAIIADYLKRLYNPLPEDLGQMLPAERGKGDVFAFPAFGRQCEIRREGVFMDGAPETGPVGILVALYALAANPSPAVVEPLKAFKDFPGTMPYVGAFATHAEGILTEHVDALSTGRDAILADLRGEAAPAGAGGDLSFLVWPLPRIALCYIAYMADEDFPASVKCLFSANAINFMPIDGLADVGEYTSRRILELITSGLKVS